MKQSITRRQIANEEPRNGVSSGSTGAGMEAIGAVLLAKGL